jgi:hypothetical protein
MPGGSLLIFPRQGCFDAGLGKVVGLDIIDAPLIDVPSGMNPNPSRGGQALVSWLNAGKMRA